MATAKQRAAARRNIKKAQQAARRKRTIAHLPKKTRTALGRRAPKQRSVSVSRVPIRDHMRLKVLGTRGDILPSAPNYARHSGS
jgi:hypothetical protein